MKRHHPMLMLLDIWKMGRNVLFFVITFFIIKHQSGETFFTYGRLVVLLAIVASLILTVLKWASKKYEVDDRSFHLYEGIFTKTNRTIPFSKVENTNQHTSLFHRLTGMTSLTFETGMSGDEAAVEFEVISTKEADRLKQKVTENTELEEVERVVEAQEESDRKDQGRRVHFKAQKKDLFKASFTSLSIFVLAPIIGSLYFKMNEIFEVKKQAKGFLHLIIDSWWKVSLALIALIVLSICFGIVRTFLKYGNYEITSDQNRIYIRKGVLDETDFVISKKNVQAVQLHQTLMKRILGLAEVKLTSVGELREDEERFEINSLYPFLPIRNAYEMVEELLPSYRMTDQMKSLPVKSFWIRMMRPSWIWMIATGVLWYFKPSILDAIDISWWLVAIVLLVMIGCARVFNYLNTKYVIHDQFIQFKSGSLKTTLFLSKRDKIIEVNVSQGLIQKKLGLATVGTMNRAKPIHNASIHDIPVELANTFYHWYVERSREVKLEKEKGEHKCSRLV